MIELRITIKAGADGLPRVVAKTHDFADATTGEKQLSEKVLSSCALLANTPVRQRAGISREDLALHGIEYK